MGATAIDEAVAGGRRGVGTTNHCVHGRDAIVEEVLAWRPPEVLTTRFQMPMTGIPKFTRSEIFVATSDGAGTEFTVNILRPSTGKDRAKLDEIRPALGSYVDGLAALRPMIEADMAARAAAAATEVPEPELPISSGRNLSGPVTAR
jgi:hypothetical protein